MNRKGQAFPYIVGGVFIGFVVVVSLFLFGVIGAGTQVSIGSGGSDTDTDSTSMGVPVDSIVMQQTNKHTKATEGSNDAEFWDKGANVADTSLSPRETLTFSSGAVTDTTVPSLRSNFGPADMDLYVEGGSSYYDMKVTSWDIDYNEQTGKGVLNGPGPSGSVTAVDIGTFKDIDTLDAVDTGFALAAAGTPGTYNYSNTTGDGSAYIRLAIGNDEPDSELSKTVFCIGDSDSDLEGDEFTSMTISSYSGANVGSINSNLLPLFSQAAGTGSMVCTSIGDIVGVTSGIYQIDFVIDEQKWNAEEFEIGIDDLGGWKARQYPSSDLKATAEDVVLVSVA